MEAMKVLERLRDLGFNFLTLERYERHMAAERGGFIAVLQYTPEGGIHQFSSAGYLIEGQIGVLVHRGPASFFVAKQKEVPATAELLERYRRFQRDLDQALGSGE